MGNIYKIVIYGLGKKYNSHINLMKLWEYQGQIEIVAVTAKNVPKANRIDGWLTVKREELIELEFDYVVIFSEIYENEMLSDLLAFGITRDKIILSRVLDMPYFNWNRYIQILRSKLSIISCNCWGGVLCHTLGMECLSPFKNLWVKADEILHMMDDLRSYMSETPYFIRWEKDLNSINNYPVMGIRDIQIHFNHDDNVDDALKKWKRRCAKINYDNLFLMIFTKDKEVVEKFLHYNGTRKICFVPRSINNWEDSETIWSIDSISGNEFYVDVNSSVTMGKNSLSFDILKMLEGKKVYRCEGTSG